MGVGIPGATLVAVFKYRLYDLDLVVRKTVVFAIVVVVFVIIALLVVAVICSSSSSGKDCPGGNERSSS